MKLGKVMLIGIGAALCFSCGASGGTFGGVDDNNVLRYKGDTSCFFKGTLTLGVYNAPEANNFFKENQKQSHTPDETYNDCPPFVGDFVSSLQTRDDGTIYIPLYETGKNNTPKQYFTQEHTGLIDDGTHKYTYLKEESGKFKWTMISSNQFFIAFTPYCATGVDCFTSIKYTMTIKYNFTYYSDYKCEEDDYVKVNQEDYVITDKNCTCYNTSLIDDDFPINFPNENIEDVYKPAIEISEISGTIDPNFRDPDQLNHLDRYIRKA